MSYIGYVRSSLELEKQMISPDAQERRIKDYCKAHDLELHDIVYDIGCSGKDLNRKYLKFIIDNRFCFEGMVISSLDRLTRSVRDLQTLVETFSKTNFSIKSIGENIDTKTPNGRMYINLMTVISEWERQTIGLRTSTAMKEMVKQGKSVGRVGFGKKVVNGFLVPCPEQQPIVDRILDLRKRGASFQKIVDILQSEGTSLSLGVVRRIVMTS